MAEGFLNSLYKNSYKAYSAGIIKAKVNPYAIEVMKGLGIDISNQYSKTIQEFKDMDFDFVVTLCDNVKESCPFFPGKKIIHKNFKDPNSCKGNIEEILECYKQVRDQIKKFIEKTFK